MNESTIEYRIERSGRKLLREMKAHRHSVMSRRGLIEKLMQWAMRDPMFKVQMFRYVDAFPTLNDSEAIYEVFQEYIHQPHVQIPGGLDLGLRAGRLAKPAFAAAMRRHIEMLARHFIAGADAAEAMPGLRKLRDQGIAFSVDLLGEACLSDAEADAYQRRYLDLLEWLPPAVGQWPHEEVLDQDHLGEIPRCNVSIKISSLSASVKLEDYEGTMQRLQTQLEPLLKTAANGGTFVNFDMEQYRYKDLTIDLFLQCCEQFDFPAGIALQTYLRSAREDAEKLVRWSMQTGRQISVRLIKGAYWDYEVIHAEQMGWPQPVWDHKWQTDACFEDVTRQMLAACPHSRDHGGIKTAIGSHNVRSIANSLARLPEYDLPNNAIEFQLLHGMADELKMALADRGLRVRSYVPVGEMVPGMAYLVRRLLENTSNQSWLRESLTPGTSVDELLKAPSEIVSPEIPNRQPLAGILPELSGVTDLEPFQNEPLRDFSDQVERQHFSSAVARTEVPALEMKATTEDAQAAIQNAQAALPGWADRDVRQRAETLLQTAARMRSRRDELASLIVHEAYKTWQEADADVCEAIDFCEFYARSAIALQSGRQLGHFLGEDNRQQQVPIGVAAVISPWNFPLAICTGMTVAALVTGNTAIIKPSGNTPAIAHRLCEILHESGVPHNVVQLLLGPGASVGRTLVEDSRVGLIAFTGSREVGFRILRTAGKVEPDQPTIKRVICEMGGKNAIIVDSTADLDEAVAGVRYSAFGYAGQKCSACSRLIVLHDTYAPLMNRLTEATKSWRVGDPVDPLTDMGPVIDHSAAKKIHEAIDAARQSCTATLAVSPVASRFGDRLIGPHIFTDVSRDDPLWRTEIFGPVLAVTVARNFDEALELANDSQYKLTGAVFSRTPQNLQRATRAFRVGNLYLNRGCTGAIVGRQPFGGFGHSGTGTKAGGIEYCRRFTYPIAISENTLRRGFAPGLNS